ncbi:MAG: hypothetical protein SFZ03_06375 [Candidatus Melainabacteria bacterium]|nr:hypothetical protein [Candidatus Melainabacteria bacterium]
MKKTLTLALLALTLVLQAGVASFADEESSTQQELGPLTTEHPMTWHTISLPFRAVTGSFGLVGGAVAGSAQGIAETEEQIYDNTFARVSENPLLFPVGLVGAVAGIPFGILKGAPPEAARMGLKGYSWWDRY